MRNFAVQKSPLSGNLITFRIYLDSDKINTSCDSERITTAQPGVGDAVGVDSRKWFIAIVNNNTEKSVKQRLDNLGFESYIATQKMVRVWKNGRRSTVDKVAIPSLVFVNCTERERRQIVNLPFINRFMTDKASGKAQGSASSVAVVPANQIDTLRFMLGQSDIPVSFVAPPFRVHDNVEVIRGSLQGIRGEVMSVEDDKCNILVDIGIIGAAKVTIDSINLKRTV